MAPAVALVAVIAGIVLVAGAGGRAEFGWFAYAPLSNETFISDDLVFLGPRIKAGLALMLLGLLLLAFWSGYRTGRSGEQKAPVRAFGARSNGVQKRKRAPKSFWDAYVSLI
ncbi:hypothetical protein [Arthrobacter polaris]|uniref:hypothetical protein n=1 Tax=Arthrobacter polaris TaxID=2813727 RepID=UPI001F22FE82|nr:hypothetical protein [Arthrobacter polaris]UIK89097.1 hypothetical protein J0916_00945 [Arthrobacter polaris]